MTDKKQLPAEHTGNKPDALSQMFTGLIELAKDQTVQPEKLEQIVNVQRTMLNDMRDQEFAKAMAAARAEMPTIGKDGSITNKNGQVQSRYAHFESIDKVVRPIAAKHGLSYGFNLTEADGGKINVSCLVTHLSEHGAMEKAFGPLPLTLDTTGSKNATQGAVSASTYGKRATLCAAFNIITENEDDDGNAGRHAGTPAQQWQKLLDDAQKAAANGTDSYAAWFKARTNMERGWLMDEGHHDGLKRAAAEQEG